MTDYEQVDKHQLVRLRRRAQKAIRLWARKHAKLKVTLECTGAQLAREMLGDGESKNREPTHSTEQEDREETSEPDEQEREDNSGSDGGYSVMTIASCQQCPALDCDDYTCELLDDCTTNMCAVRLPPKRCPLRESPMLLKLKDA